MAMTELYRNTGLDIYEKVHYGQGEHIHEVEQIVSWYPLRSSRVLDLGCSGGLHALEFARRGHRVTGIDVEPSAIELARKRNDEQHLDVRFNVVDLEETSLARFGTFDLVYSIGNVLSHITRERIHEVMHNIRECCAPGGFFLFDILVIGAEFPEEVHEDERGIIWKRRLDTGTGMIALQGIFTEYAVTQEFRVWGYTVDDVLKILDGAGFTGIEYADSLDFPHGVTLPPNPVCLRFRARG